MKKTFTIYFLLLLFVQAHAQSSVSEKANNSATKTTKTTNAKSIVAKNEVEKDSIKKNKLTLVNPTDKAVDSTQLVDGVFKFYKKDAHASYYADKFNGKRTASGKRFDNSKYTAAHKKFPFGTKLRITNEKNGKSIIVEVIDRGPFVRSREIDLTKRAFMEITANKGSGAMLVKIEVLNN
ncbi:MAG: septal ring lytic transglycosylase RlpA family protein [Flavobacterium sp.]